MFDKINVMKVKINKAIRKHYMLEAHVSVFQTIFSCFKSKPQDDNI